MPVTKPIAGETMKSISDLSVIKRVLAGDTDAFADLITRYRDRVFAVAARHVPRDAVAEVAHETFVEAFKSLSRYAPDRPFEHWLFRITVRCCYDYWREKYRRKEIPAGGTPEEARPLANPAAIAGTDPAKSCESREWLEKILGTLAPEDRMVLTLVYFESFTIAETARIMNWKESKVKVRAHRARKHLRAQLQKTVEKGR